MVFGIKELGCSGVWGTWTGELSRRGQLPHLLIYWKDGHSRLERYMGE